MKNIFRSSAVVITIIGASSLLIGCTKENEKPPNIILIMSDDQGWGDSELNGNNIIDTPNLNKIAAKGASLERFYVNPMCAPTRASLLTGKYNLRSGTTWVGRRTDFLSLDATTLADVLKEAGYATGCYGKWHVGEYGPYHPNERGFDDYTGMLVGASRNYHNTRLNNNGKNFRSDAYITDVLTDSALNFIESNKAKPFFCYIPYNVPHHPFQVPQKYFDKYKNRGVKQDNTAAVYGMIDNMDENIGRIMEYLDENELTENTIVIFMSDNGPAFHRFNDGLAGKKAEVSEGSVRVPFYIQWKNKIPARQRIFNIAAHIDLFPTLLDAANITKPDSIDFDGISLLPLLLGEENSTPDRAIYTHQTVFGKSLITPGGLRTQKYRLVNWKSGYELYDMENDPSQKRNLAGEEVELTKKLISDYENWYAEVTKNGLGKPPVPVGYPGYDTVDIRTPDALISSQLKYSGRWGWVDDYVVNWTRTSDSVIFEIDVYTPGTYELALHYWCNEKNAGSEFKLSGEAGSKSFTIDKGDDTKIIPEDPHNMNNTPRAINWLRLNLGTMELQEGEQKFILQAVNISGEYAAEVKSLELIRK
jgi:arylsulfatase A